MNTDSLYTFKRFACYLKFWSAVKCVSSLHSKPLTIIRGATVKPIRKHTVLYGIGKVYIFLFWGTNIILFKYIGLETILVLLGF